MNVLNVVLTPVSALATRLGVSRDDAKLIWAKLGAGAMLVYTGVFNINTALVYLGFAPWGPTGQHRLEAVCIVVLWIGGELSTSQLFPKGRVPTATP